MWLEEPGVKTKVSLQVEVVVTEFDNFFSKIFRSTLDRSNGTGASLRYYCYSEISVIFSSPNAHACNNGNQFIHFLHVHFAPLSLLTQAFFLMFRSTLEVLGKHSYV